MAACSRPGCGKLEATAGAFLTCSRCNAKAYCSTTCEKADQCSGHGACTVQALQEAAEAGVFTTPQYQQVVQILKWQPPYDPPGTPVTNSSPWFTCPQTALTLAALRALRTALSHPPTNPIAPPPALVSSNILPAVTAIVPPIPDTVCAFVDASYYLILDTLAAAVSALLSHPLRQMLDPSTPPAAFARWAPIIRIFTHHPAYCRWLVEGGFFHVSGSQVSSMNSAARTVWSAAGLSGPPPQPSHMFGTEMLLCLGNLFALCGSLDLEMLCIPRKFLCQDLDGVTGSDKVAKVLEQQAVQLPHEGLAELLTTISKDSDGFSARVLLRSPGALRALARPLEALAADPLLACQELDIYRGHLRSIDKGLVRWVASDPGLPGLRQLSQHLARPTIAALDALLQLGQDNHEAAVLPVVGCLELMTHMAYTADGQSCMAAAGCAPRWLELAPRWKGQPVVLEQLLLLLLVPFQSPGMLYFKRLPLGSTGLHTADEQRPPLLDKQMGSIVAMDSIAQLIKGMNDDTCTALLLELLQRLMRTRAAAPLPPQLASALARFCRPPVRPAQGRGRLQTTDMIEFFSEARFSDRSIQQQALLVLMEHCFALKQHEGTSGSQGGRAGAGARGRVSDDVLDLLVEWLQLCGTKGGVRRGTSHLTSNEVLNYRAAVYGLMGAALSSGNMTLEVLKKRRVLELWFRTLPPLEDDDETLTVAFMALDANGWDPVQAGRLFLHLQELSQQKGCIDAVLAFLSRRVRQELGGGQPLHAAVGELPGNLALMDVVFAFASSITTGNASAAGKLLAAMGVWDYFKSVVVEQAEVIVGTAMHSGMLGMWEVLNRCLAQGGGLQQQAGAVVRRLGRATVDQVLQAPWLAAQQGINKHTRLDLLLGVFERGSAAGVSAAGAPATNSSRSRISGSSSAAAPPTAPSAAGRGAAGQAAPLPASARPWRQPGGALHLSKWLGRMVGFAVGAEAGDCGGVPKAKEGEGAAHAPAGPAASSATCSGAGPTPAAGSSGAQLQAADTMCASSGRSALAAAASTSRSCGADEEAAAKECSVCHTQPEQTFLCSVCKGVRYCSRECQKADWKRHKKACKQL